MLRAELWRIRNDLLEQAAGLDVDEENLCTARGFARAGQSIVNLGLRVMKERMTA
jgi:hypothetical protein